jgi:hypothetical protein
MLELLQFNAGFDIPDSNNKARRIALELACKF